eukprot:c32916_g1_i1 orf=187-618(+)
MDLKVSDKASQLAREWVRNMSGGENVDSEEVNDTEPKMDGRPARLGLGAEYVPHSHLTTTLNPVERKLRAKLNVSKGATDAQAKVYKARQSTENSNPGTGKNEDIDDEDEVGRGSLFNRKQRSDTLNAHLLEPKKGNKKRKKS